MAAAEQYISPHLVNEVPCMKHVDICGLSGRFPESSSASEFFQNLVSGVDMVTADERKWKRVIYDNIPERCGKMKSGELFSFDAQFFGVHGQQAKKMDPQLYKLLEVSWEAWMDSGIDVRSLRDSNRVGVYTGICGSEIHGVFLKQENDVTGYEQTGCVMSMTANRLSYFYSFRGPSKTCDTACSSAAHSLHDAIADITAGRTDYAIVLGSCHLLMANMTLAFDRLHMLSPEGACKAFDAAGNGYVRSEGIAAIVLKRSDLASVPRWAAVSPYATILNCAVNNDGFTKEGITFPSKNAQLALEKQVCTMGGINPAEVCYVEAHGTGTVAGDGQELDAINRWYGTAAGRSDPLLIGSVKSNMGHCEGASCLASVIKVCLALEYGMMPGNLHYHRDTPNPDSVGLRDGTLKVVDETQPFQGGLMALSNFGFGGANFHMVMKGKASERSQLLLSDSSSSSGSSSGEPLIGENMVPLAARTSHGLAYLAKVINDAEAADGVSFAEPLRRYANSVAKDTKLCHRGVLENGELKTAPALNKLPEVWFAFSGNGSQWSKMAQSLISSSAVFLRAVADCAAAVRPLGIDLMAEFQAERGFKTPLMNSLGLIAVQIGLVDLLKEEFGITPAGMLGHSAGKPRPSSLPCHFCNVQASSSCLHSSPLHC